MMTQERDLNRLLADVKPALDPEIFVFSTVPPDAALPPAVKAVQIFLKHSEDFNANPRNC